MPNDEIVGWIGQLQPQVLMVYGTIPSACPMVRQLIDLLHDVGICPKLQIICSGGVFNRAEGLGGGDWVGFVCTGSGGVRWRLLADAYPQ